LVTGVESSTVAFISFKVVFLDGGENDDASD
jgi:hypothetical protein